MAGEWRETILGEFVSLQRGHDLTESERRTGCVPVMGSAGQNGFHDVALAEGPGIVIGRSGASFGQVHYSPDDYWPHNTALYVTDFKGNDPHFAFYFLKSIDFSRFNSGSAQPSLNRNFIYPIPVRFPPLPEQKAIAQILGTLDDKIELNRRMNATLEAMARALFQSWFVDFDPVRAKLDGRVPVGMDAETAALFPAAFQESSLGLIPIGWEVGRLDDMLTLQRGFDLPAFERTYGTYPVMAASGPNGCHDKFMVHGPGVTTGRSGVLGKVFFIHGDFWPLNTSLWVKEFKRVSPAYALHLLRGLDFEMFNAGSAVPTLNRNHVHFLPVVMPPKHIVYAFDALVMPLMKQQEANIEQSRTLAALRDTLLPKLLSGELRVGDTAQAITKVTQ